MKARPSGNLGKVTFELNRGDEPLMEAASREAVRSRFAIKRILVPIDFSDCSKKALQYALPFAHEHNAAITLLYVVPPAYAAGEYGGIDYAQLEALAKAEGAKELIRLALNDVADEIVTGTLVRVGSPAREIIETAKSLPADLIVISTHGRTGFRHVAIGSVTEHVVRCAPCPVLVVREHEHEFFAS